MSKETFVWIKEVGTDSNLSPITSQHKLELPQVPVLYSWEKKKKSYFIFIPKIFSLEGTYLLIIFLAYKFSCVLLKAELLCIEKTGLFNGWRRKVNRKENPAYSFSVIFFNLNNRTLCTVQWYSPFEMGCMLIILIVCILLSFWKHVTNVRKSLPTCFKICNPYYFFCWILKWWKSYTLHDKTTEGVCHIAVLVGYCF